ncbi:alginate export family protein [Roseimicrobium sp. ORNL1]|uniref:alginate export family protein n=1 Tax=Roseimicrobium sp. ORNL1 TaxID=2711231 RepID=UPI0013E1D2A7|nr:alginate export family protein [Roseimicrobium sp. ORNL1]QIF01327.1 alginate export family protein [Roseimicrobium sp. ORNL1]
MKTLRNSASALLLSATCLWAGEPATSPKAPVIPPPKEPVSAGLLNDYLRSQSPAFSEWDLGVQFRTRYELKDDAGSFPNRDFISRGQNNSNDYFLFREKIHVGWQPESWLKVFVQGRGAQVASDERDPSPDEDSFDLHQAYIQLGDPKLFPLTLKVGRQEMLYGDERFIGIGDWSNVGRSFDAVNVRWSLGKATWIDLFASNVVIARDDYFNESNDEDLFSGIYASSQEIVSTLETQAFFLARNVDSGSPNAIAPGVGGPSERDVYTYGVRIKSLPKAFGDWDFTFESAGQFGEVVSGGRELDLQSYAITGSFGYTFANAWGKPRVGLGYDYGSGDGDPNDGKQETFEQLFGTNHRFYGLMDLTGLRNTNSPRVSFSIKPSKKLTVSLDYLLFWLADTNDFFYPESGSGRNVNGYGRNPSFDSFVGSELDLLVRYSPTPRSDLQVGYGHFFPGDYIKSSVGRVPANGGATGADWVYVQATFNF